MKLVFNHTKRIVPIGKVISVHRQHDELVIICRLSKRKSKIIRTLVFVLLGELAYLFVTLFISLIQKII